MDFAVSYRLKSGEEILKQSLIDFKNAELANLNYFRRVWTTRNQKILQACFFSVRQSNWFTIAPDKIRHIEQSKNITSHTP